MGDFSRRLGPNGQDQWWLEILGKGQRARRVPASPELIVELARYRQACGLPSLPRRAEDTPLVMPFRDPRRGLSRSALHDAIKRIFLDAASWLHARGPEFADQADELVRASVHWLRHTAGSHQADGGLDLRTVRDNLGHVSLTTTSLYLHEEEDTRHRQTVRGHRMNWGDQEPVAPPARPPAR